MIISSPHRQARIVAVGKKPSAGTGTVEDVAAAKAAAAAFFAEVRRLRAGLDKAAGAPAAAESRRAEGAEGAWMTAGESVAVHAAVQAPAFEPTRALIKGATTRNRAGCQAVRDRADAVECGLIIEGYTEVERA